MAFDHCNRCRPHLVVAAWPLVVQQLCRQPVPHLGHAGRVAPQRPQPCTHADHVAVNSCCLVTKGDAGDCSGGVGPDTGDVAQLQQRKAAAAAGSVAAAAAAVQERGRLE